MHRCALSNWCRLLLRVPGVAGRQQFTTTGKQWLFPSPCISLQTNLTHGAESLSIPNALQSLVGQQFTAAGDELLGNDLAPGSPVEAGESAAVSFSPQSSAGRPEVASSPVAAGESAAANFSPLSSVGRPARSLARWSAGSNASSITTGMDTMITRYFMLQKCVKHHDSIGTQLRLGVLGS